MTEEKKDTAVEVEQENINAEDKKNVISVAKWKIILKHCGVALGCLIIIIVFGELLKFCLSVYAKSSPPSMVDTSLSKEKQAEQAAKLKFLAYVKAKQFVKNILLSPTSAKFKNYTDLSSDWKGKNKFACCINVEGKNINGAMIQATVLVKLKYNSHNEWIILERKEIEEGPENNVKKIFFNRKQKLTGK